MSEYLPEDVLVKIFLLLPTKAIIQCTSVCKSWYFLITSPTFISSHLNNQDDHLLVRYCAHPNQNCHNIFPYRDGDPVKEFYALYYDNENFDKHVEFDMPFMCESEGYFNIVSSCNGLLCLSDDLRSYNNNLFYLWNPSIRKSIKLPKPNFTFEYLDYTLGFGFDPVTNDYKVLRIVHSGSKTNRVPPYVELYKLSTGVWHDISHVAPSYEFFDSKPGVYLNGACHWVASKRKQGKYHDNNWIVLFDVEEETFWEMMVPGSLIDQFWFSGGWIKLFVSEESLCLADRLSGDDETVDIWRMNEYGDPESWVKQLSINLSHVTFKRLVYKIVPGQYCFGQQTIDHFLRKPIASRKNGEILWTADNGRLVSYDIAAEKIKDLDIRNADIFPYQHALYVDNYKVSLVLLDKQIDYFAGNPCEESSDLCKTKSKSWRKSVKRNNKRGLKIVSPLRISGLMYW